MKAEDQNYQLVDVKYNGEKVNVDSTFSDEVNPIEISSKETQILKFKGSDNYGVNAVDEKGNVLPSKELTPEELVEYVDFIEKKETRQASGETESSDKVAEKKDLEEETKESQLVYVGEKEKKTPYVLIHKDQPLLLSVFKDSEEEEVPVTFEKPNTAEKQKLFRFIEKVEQVPEESKKAGQETAEVTNDQTIDQLMKKNYSEKDSFKPIELPAKELSQKQPNDTSQPLAVTGAKVTVKTGTANTNGKFDDNDLPGYDSSESNDIVRSFDSNFYLLSFSIEANHTDTTYTDIKYRVDMELPHAYGLSSGKPRFRYEVVDNEHGELVDAPGNQKTSKGYVESTISANGQVFLPIVVNVYGAEQGDPIYPEAKITILSAKNEQTGETEEINKTYTKTDIRNLKLKDTYVSAKPSVEANLVLGSRTAPENVIPAIGVNNNHESVSLGVTLGLSPIEGREKGDFKGSTFPNGAINVTIGSDSFYQKDSTSAITPVPTIDGTDFSKYTKPTKATTSTISSNNPTDWNKILYAGSELKIPNGFTNIAVPNGKSEQLHVVEPQVGLEEKKQIGVYDSGKTTVTNSDTDLSIHLKNEEYSPIYNPYTYTLKGVKTNNNEKLFSSSTLLVLWPKHYLIRKGVGLFSTKLKISEVSYEGQKKIPNPASTVTISDSKEKSGAYIGSTAYAKKVKNNFIGLNSTGRVDVTAGDGTVGKGEKDIYVGGTSVFDKMPDVKKSISYIRWNANSFEYDPTREINVDQNDSVELVEAETRYGVGKTKDYPTLKTDTEKNISGQYNWYSSPQEATKYGKISAIKAVFNKKKDLCTYWFGAPVNVIGEVGQNDKFGNPNAIMHGFYFFDSNNVLIENFPGINESYTPSVYDSSGKATKPNTSRGGDSIFIKPFKIETTTTPEKPTYKTNETIRWKVEGNLLGTTDTNYGSRLTTYLPKGIKYTPGTSVDSNGNKIPEPTVTENASNGVTTLVWRFSNINPTKGDLIEAHFDTTADVADLTFDKYSLAEVEARTIGELWLQSDPNQKDTSAASTRTSYGKVNLHQTQQIILTKKEDKPAIEAGEKDPVGVDNKITYTIDMANESVEDMIDVQLADVLPYNGDSRGSKFNGRYTVEDVRFDSKSKATIKYSNDEIDNKTDPSKFPEGTTFEPGKTAIEDIKDAKAVWVNLDRVAVGEKVRLTVTIKPNGQKAGDLYVNNAGMNSKLDLPVNSQNVKTLVYGRNLSGVAWYDDLPDGLIGKAPNGSPEDFVKDIPVKLYRTSLVDSSYKDELVKESLTGQKFIDESGNSLIKTDNNGKYLFENLPEGEYVVEFMIEDMVVQKKFKVTEKLVGDDPKINSKADTTTYKTDPYTQPKLEDVAKSDEFIHSVPDLNIGLIRETASIRLFKYAAGTAVDLNKDGELTDNEKATGTPLKGAVFDLYEGDREKKIGSATTDDMGIIRFDDLAPGEYTLVETKAPDGYELLQKPIKVTITENNQTVQLYQDNDAQTLLPEAGGNNPLLIGLILSSIVLVGGLAGVMYYYRNPKQRGKL
ncbi:SpaA isopeptide-forming pilin-related protein [Enterococcus sp. DIV0800]|uniref:SpaA isopeptide-forming pilin-related protein n=1 Tax=unclassified Enterococcus TaxID=2608891 RepID=UPI003D2FB0C7